MSSFLTTHQHIKRLHRRYKQFTASKNLVVGYIAEFTVETNRTSITCALSSKSIYHQLVGLYSLFGSDIVLLFIMVNKDVCTVMRMMF